jgi:hypothetical protein
MPWATFSSCRRSWDDLSDETSSQCSTGFLSEGADGTDGADSLIARLPYADDPISSSTLASKCNVDTDRLKECLRATQSAGEGTTVFGPVEAVTALARALNADSQKIGGAPRPKGTFAH